LGAISCGLFLLSCSKRYSDLPAFTSLPVYDSYNNSVGRFKTSYLADQIHAYFRGNASAPIAVATFVDLDNLYGASSFGRLLGEQLMSELAMKGYNVLEIRHTDAMQVIQEGGEFGLSRDVERLRKHYDISALVVGTYTASPDRVYINARLIDPSSSLVLSAGSVEMDKTEEITRLLRANALPQSLERMPVKPLAMNQEPGVMTGSWPYNWQNPYTGKFQGKVFQDPTEASEPPMIKLPEAKGS
jgi:TolB-like protein